MITKRGRVLAAAAITVAVGCGLALAQDMTATAATVRLAPSPWISEVPWCTSEAPPSTYLGGPSYAPQCPGPYVSPSGPAATAPVFGPPPTTAPRWLPQPAPATSPAAGCRTVQDWRTAGTHRYRVLLCGAGTSERLTLQTS